MRSQNPEVGKVVGQIEEVKFNQNKNLYLDVKNSRSRFLNSNYESKNNFP